MPLAPPGRVFAYAFLPIISIGVIVNPHYKIGKGMHSRIAPVFDRFPSRMAELGYNLALPNNQPQYIFYNRSVILAR
jgi:hypothetical protein